MAELIRKRHGAAPPIVGDRVRIDQTYISLPDYEDLIFDQQSIVLAKLDARQSIDELAAKIAVEALTCGRLIASQTGDDRAFERAKYCRKPSLCRCCHRISLKLRANVQVNDLAANQGGRLLHYLFSVPPPTNNESESDLIARLRNIAIPRLQQATATWSRRKGECYQIGHYIIGLHTNQSRIGPYFQPHIHLAIFVHPRCPFAYDNGLTETYKLAYANALGIWPCPVVRVDDLGILTTAADVRLRKNRKLVTIEHATNVFAYASDPNEVDDTCDVIKRREIVFREAGISATATRSRRRRGPDPVAQVAMPHVFHPERLQKSRLIIIDFDGISREGSPDAFDMELRCLRRNAMQLLRRTFN